MTFFYSNCHCIDPTVKAVAQRLKDPLRAKRDTHASDYRCALGHMEDYFKCA